MARFFSDNYSAFRELSEKLSRPADIDGLDPKLVDLTLAGIKAITFNREEYDVLVQYTAAARGEGFLSLLEQPLTTEVLARILGGLAGFIREATLVRSSRSDSEQKVLDYFLGYESTLELDAWNGYTMDYVAHVLPHLLLKEKLSGLAQLRADYDKTKEDSIREVADLEERIKGHQDQLKRLESQYNFVGLTHAFQGLLTAKKSSRDRALWLVALLAVAAVGVPVAILWGDASLLDGAFGANWSPSAVARLLASAAVELVVLYYFRISLRSFLLAENQRTNLQLRVALCSFVEGYLDFAERATRAKSTNAVANFESLIFSSLPSDDGKLPATLEGIEHIAKIAQNLRSAD